MELTQPPQKSASILPNRTLRIRVRRSYTLDPALDAILLFSQVLDLFAEWALIRQAHIDIRSICTAFIMMYISLLALREKWIIFNNFNRVDRRQLRKLAQLCVLFRCDYSLRYYKSFSALNYDADSTQSVRKSIAFNWAAKGSSARFTRF